MNDLELEFLILDEAKGNIGLSFSSSSSQSSRSEIYHTLKNLPANTPIDWSSPLIKAISNDPSLRWINDLQALELSDQELYNFFTEIQRMDTDSFDQSTTTQLFLFTEASLLIENQLQPSPLSTLKASLLFYSLHDQLARRTFHLASFIDRAGELLAFPEKRLLSLFMLYIKACASTDNSNHALFIQTIVKDVFLSESHVDWLPVFLDQFNEKTFSKHSSLFALLTAIETQVQYNTALKHLAIHKVFHYYRQLLKIDILGTILSASADPIKRKEDLIIPSLRLAHNIISAPLSPFSFNSEPVKSSDFPHIRWYNNLISGDIYLSSSHTRSYSAHSERTYKSRLDVRLPSNPVEDPTNLTVDKNRSIRAIIDLRQAAETHQRITGNRGIWPLFGTCFYKRETKDVTYRLRTFSPYCELLSSIRKPLAFDTLLTIFEDLACGIDYLHSNGLIHGMIDLKNAVINGEHCKKIEAGWVGFAMTCTPHTDLFTNGYYGSQYYTAPEILKKKAIDAYKADIWAFGQAMLQLLQSGNLPWHLHQKQLTALLEEFVEKPKQELSAKELSPPEALELLIYCMLQVDLTLRPDSKKILNTLALIRNHSIS